MNNTSITLIADSEAVIAKAHEILSVKTELEGLMSWLKIEAAQITSGFGHSSTDYEVQYEIRLNQTCHDISQVLEIVTSQANGLEKLANCYSVPEQSNNHPEFK